MTVTVTNLLQGPADVWTAIVGSVEPTSNATAPAVAWIDAGGTEGGVSARINQGYTNLTVDQIAGAVDARLTDLTLAVVTSFAEATLANLRTALNQAVNAATKIEIDPTIKNASPTYAAVMLRGKAPGGTGRTVILRRALSTENIELAHTKGDKTVVPVTFTGFYVSASVKPIIIDDTP